jgi:hypothetical protein
MDESTFQNVFKSYKNKTNDLSYQNLTLDNLLKFNSKNFNEFIELYFSDNYEFIFEIKKLYLERNSIINPSSVIISNQTPTTEQTFSPQSIPYDGENSYFTVFLYPSKIASIIFDKNMSKTTCSFTELKLESMQQKNVLR